MPAGSTTPRNPFVAGTFVRTFVSAVVPEAPGWEIRGDITRAAATSAEPPDVTVRAFAIAVDASQINADDLDYSSGTRTSIIPGGGEDTSDAAAETRFFELADQIASELPAFP